MFLSYVFTSSFPYLGWSHTHFQLPHLRLRPHPIRTPSPNHQKNSNKKNPTTKHLKHQQTPHPFPQKRPGISRSAALHSAMPRDYPAFFIHLLSLSVQPFFQSGHHQPLLLYLKASPRFSIFLISQTALVASASHTLSSSSR